MNPAVLSFLTIIGVGISAYFGAYLKRKGENLATHEDINKVLVEVRATPQATKRSKQKYLTKCGIARSAGNPVGRAYRSQSADQGFQRRTSQLGQDCTDNSNSTPRCAGNSKGQQPSGKSERAGVNRIF